MKIIFAFNGRPALLCLFDSDVGSRKRSEKRASVRNKRSVLQSYFSHNKVAMAKFWSMVLLHPRERKKCKELSAVYQKAAYVMLLDCFEDRAWKRGTMAHGVQKNFQS